ncbi:MAG: CoA transferase subunit A [Clostridia bacterium]|nr:MAG: CoA transferase subunit A [Clostridia bacterium]
MAKVMSLEDAISKFVQDGSTVLIGGTYMTDEPVAAAHEIIRQGKKDLTLVLGEAACMVGDLLIGAGCVKKIVSSLLGFMRLKPIAPRYRRAIERCDLEVWEAEQNHVHAALRAAAQGVPFMPTLSGVGCDYHKVNPDIKVLQDPFGDRTVNIVKAIEPDVTIVHTATSDDWGNAQHGGSLHYDILSCRAAKKVIVMTEQVVSYDHIRKNPDKTHVIGYNVAAVVEMPFGAYPSEGQACYRYDLDHYREYLRMAETDAGFEEYLDKYVRGKAHNDFLQLAAGTNKLLELQTGVH